MCVHMMLKTIISHDVLPLHDFASRSWFSHPVPHFVGDFRAKTVRLGSEAVG